MFNATISADILQSSIRAMSALMEECVFKITPDGMSARAVCPANASMCAIDLPSEVFSVYDVTEAELGVDLQRFIEILGMSEKNSDVTLELDEDTHKLNITFGGFAYTMGLLDPSTLRKSPDIPQLDLPAEITIEGAAFKRMIKAASMMGDHMMMGVLGEMFFMSADGDSDKVRLDLSGSELIGLKSADVSSLYSLEYLTDMGKGIGSANEIIIHIGRDLPVNIEFESSAGCEVVYILAPRITGD